MTDRLDDARPSAAAMAAVDPLRPWFNCPNDAAWRVALAFDAFAAARVSEAPAPAASEAVAWGLRSMGRIYATRLTWLEAESEAQARQDRDGEGARPDVVALYDHPTPRAEALAVVEAAEKVVRASQFVVAETLAAVSRSKIDALAAAVREYRKETT